MSALLPAAADLEPVSLAELNASAQLMTRIDRKYFVPRAVLDAVLRESDGWRVLEIDGRRAFRYRTVYFDSARFGFYRQHVQRRRHRFKVRTRTYCDSGDCLLEVKSKGYRGRTVKQRIPHDAEYPGELGIDARRFVTSITGEDAAGLRPVLETFYHRTTLSQGRQRVTLDVDLECAAGASGFHGPDDVLVETKSPATAGELDRMLLARGIRPHSVSKYCVSAALLYPHLPRNPWSRTLRRYFAQPDGR